VPRSVLLEGVLAENAEAARAQVWSFDHATVIGEITRRLPRLADQASRKLPLIGPLSRFISGAIPECGSNDPIRHAREDDLIIPITPGDWRAAKLGRLLRHFDLRFASAPSDAELLDLCLEAEARAVTSLTRLAGPGRSKKGVAPFEGGTVLDLAQYVLRRVFRELDNGFAMKPRDEQERIATDIAKLLAELPPDLRERIRKEAGLADLSAAALKKTGAIAGIGGALVGTVGVAGFAAYTTLTSAIAASAGLFGLTLPFTVYLHATAALAFLSNPLVLAAATLLGGRLALVRANRQIRDQLVLVMVATAVMASITGDTLAADPIEIVSVLARYNSIRQTGDRKLQAQIDNTFQCLPKIT
jgi:hypothetical protein